jgi:hypothetical protein
VTQGTAPALRIATDCAAIRGGGHGEAGAAGRTVGAERDPGRSAKTGRDYLRLQDELIAKP